MFEVATFMLRNCTTRARGLRASPAPIIPGVDGSDGMSWRTVGAEYLFSSPWCSFRVDEVELPDGARIGYGVLESGGFAAVVPMTGDGRVVLVRQWRQPVDGFTLELPGGGVEAGEDPGETVRRELREEAGYEARDLVHMFTLHTSPGRSTEVCHLFRCTAQKLPTGSAPEPTEFVSALELPLSEAREKAACGEITAATTVLGLMLADGVGPSAH